MPRQMSPEREREYAVLHAYLDFYSTHVAGIDPASPTHPTTVGRRIVEEYGRSKALEGLKQAVNDTVEQLRDQPLEYIQRLDAELRERGIVTFSEVRRRYASSYKRILKRGNIKTETEYYIIAGVLADFSSFASSEERAVLDKLVAQYEQGV
ncbi:hypothetical protein [Hydrogenophaga luteola]|uniref:Uncharacterized protein n=1 Tax=Hydrogenophaga luteola TaxID=1591122 RepID=A0ABV7W5X0_9BURK